MIRPQASLRPTRLGACSVVLALALIAGPAMSQSGWGQGPADPAPAGKIAQAPGQADPVADLLQQRGETYSRASDAEQNPEELRVTSALNAEIASRNALAENQEAADRAAYDAAQAQYKDQMAAADSERLRFEAETQAAEAARLQYERDMADWRATVDACQRNDITRCRAGSMAPPVYRKEPVG